jgi:hypothetical protein
MLIQASLEVLLHMSDICRKEWYLYTQMAAACNLMGLALEHSKLEAQTWLE